MNRSNRHQLQRRGFTLLELIVVITIIGILGTVVVMNVAGHTDKARRQKVKYDLQKIYEAAEMYKVETSYWPEAIDELVNAKHPDTGVDLGGLKNKPTDPWGNEYEYELIDGSPVIRCLGKDASGGGEGENEDLQYPEENLDY